MGDLTEWGTEGGQAAVRNAHFQSSYYYHSISFHFISFHFMFHKFVYACWHCPIITDLYQVTLSCSNSQRRKNKTRGNAAIQPQSHPIPQFYILNGLFLRGWVWQAVPKSCWNMFMFNTEGNDVSLWCSAVALRVQVIKRWVSQWSQSL